MARQELLPRPRAQELLPKLLKPKLIDKATGEQGERVLGVGYRRKLFAVQIRVGPQQGGLTLLASNIPFVMIWICHATKCKFVSYTYLTGVMW